MYLTPRQEKRLRRDSWAISTTDRMTDQAIVDYVLHRSGEEPYMFRLEYQGKFLYVYSVSFETVKFFARRRQQGKYIFTAYRREKAAQWQVWSEGMRSPGAQIKLAFHGLIPPPIPAHTRYFARKRAKEQHV